MYRDFSRIYDSLIEEDFSFENCLNFIVERIKEKGIGTDVFIDMGCGSGRLSQLLQRHFKRGILVDSSEDMLQMAVERFPLKDAPQFILNDAASFRTGTSADLIVSTLDVPNYFRSPETVDRFIRNSFRNLKDHGLLIFDIRNPAALREMNGRVFTLDDDTYFHAWENSLRSEEADGNEYLDMTLNIFTSEDGESYRRVIEEQTMLVMEPEEIIRMAEEAAFLTEVYNGYSSLKGVTLEEGIKIGISAVTDERIVFVMEKHRDKENSIG